VGGLIQGPKGFGEICVQLKEIAQERLRYLARRQINAVQSAKEGEGLEPRCF
jgi:hypothetical protein